MFYAPWCGHCKKLEPIWKHVDQTLTGKYPIRVGRIDCTRFTTVATEFAIRGFPTILFIKGDRVFEYEGDRTRDDIVNFALRVMGPAVTQLNTIGDFEEAKKRTELFFMFSGVSEGSEWEDYEKVANHLQQHEFFYQTENAKLAEKFSGVKETQTIRVFKDGISYRFDEEFPATVEISAEEQQRLPRDLIKDDANAQDLASSETVQLQNKTESLRTWILRERFPKFVKVTRGRFNHLMSTKKLLVMAVVEENKLGELSPDHEAFKSMLSTVLETNIDKYRPHFQFGWCGSPDLANSVAMDMLSLPHLIVVNSSSYQHFLPNDEPIKMTPEVIVLFIDSILEGEAPVYGGSSYTVRLYRAYYEAKTNIYDMWRGNPALTAVLFGLPLGFFALICYSICCADIMDADEDEEELLEPDSTHEKID